MTFATAIALCVVLACALGYLVGLTAGYSGCVAQAGEIFTNNVMRGM